MTLSTQIQCIPLVLSTCQLVPPPPPLSLVAAGRALLLSVY
nr:MAG TPA: hypothetical protein [Caudoviricetes sp.]